MSTTTAAPTATAKKQFVLSVSEDAKNTIDRFCEAFSAPSKSKELMAMTRPECIDALLAFADAHRIQEKVETDDEGNETIVEVDALALEFRRTMALRGETIRANSATAKLEAKEREIAELKAMLEKLQGVTA